MGILQMLIASAQSLITGLVAFNYFSVEATGGLNQTAGYRINTSGLAQSRIRSTYATLETWLLSGSSSDYEVYATLISGDGGSGTYNAWVACNTSPEWAVVSIEGGTSTSASINFDCRRISDGAPLDSWIIDLYAAKDI